MRTAALQHPASHAASTDLLIGGAALALCCAAVLSPAAAASGPVVCPFRLVTGVECPACGSVRAWTSAMHGDLTGAAAYNPFALVTLVAAIGVVTWRCLSLAAPQRVTAPNLERIARSPLTLAVLAAWITWWLAGFVG